jgi:hypothetical protein
MEFSCYRELTPQPQPITIRVPEDFSCAGSPHQKDKDGDPPNLIPGEDHDFREQNIGVDSIQ